MQVGLIGCGNMGRALARGWRRPLVCSDPIAERARKLAAAVSGEVSDDARAVASILAVTPLRALREAFPGRPVYRFLPSLPVEVRQGAVVQAVDGGEGRAADSATGGGGAVDA